MELYNTVELYTERFNVTAQAKCEGDYSEVLFELVDEVERNTFKAIQSATLYLGYDDLDKVIKLLEYAKSQLNKD